MSIQQVQHSVFRAMTGLCLHGCSADKGLPSPLDCSVRTILSSGDKFSRRTSRRRRTAHRKHGNKTNWISGVPLKDQYCWSWERGKCGAAGWVGSSRQRPACDLGLHAKKPALHLVNNREPLKDRGLCCRKQSRQEPGERERDQWGATAIC